MQTIDIKLFNTALEAPIYRQPEFNGATLVEAVIVRDGTVNGNPTVDLIFMDAEGKKYVTMVTFALLDAVRAAATGTQSAQNA